MQKASSENSSRQYRKCRGSNGILIENRSVGPKMLKDILIQCRHKPGDAQHIGYIVQIDHFFG